MNQVTEAPAAAAAQRPSPVRIRKLGHIVLQVRNLERSIKFYTEVLNFHVSDNATAGGVFLNAVGDHHTIGLFPSDGEDAPVPPKGAVRLHHFAFQVDSIDDLFAVRSYLRERGIPIVWEGRRAMGGHTSVEFLDPDGYHVELYCDMDQFPPGARSRPRDPNAKYDTLEKSRDNPKPPTW
jgi:catechol 2,3-dioxygenase-like lactoylglutathione lyase family enzyme